MRLRTEQDNIPAIKFDLIESTFEADFSLINNVS
jgi:hypothetical protein